MTQSINVLGLSAFYHDSAAALLVDGKIVAAAQEERFTRKKHDAAFPANAVAYCLEEAGLSLAEIDYITFYDKPLVKFERLLETYLAFAPKGFRSFVMAIPVWLKEKLFLKVTLKRELAALSGLEQTALTATAISRTSRLTRRIRLLCQPVQESSGALPRRGWGVGDKLGMAGRWLDTDTAMGNTLPTLLRAAVFGIHLLHRLQGQFGGIQTHGARALWRAQVRRPHQSPSHRYKARRNVSFGHALF